VNQESTHNPQDQSPQGDGALPKAVLLRMAADGELDALGQQQLDDHLRNHPEDQACIDGERQLRSACARALAGAAAAPPALRTRVEALLADTRTRTTRASGASDDHRDSVPESFAPQTRSRSFWRRQAIVRFTAAAAMLALVATVAFMVGRTSPNAWAPAGTRIAAFARHEHSRCMTDMPTINSKFTVTELDKVPDAFSAITGKPVSLPTILHAERTGLHFVDAGECHLPGQGKSMQIRFRIGDNSNDLVSLWVQDDDGTLPLKEGVTYATGTGNGCVRLWRIGSVRYVLVCPDAEAAPMAIKALQVPTKTEQF